MRFAHFIGGNDASGRPISILTNKVGTAMVEFALTLPVLLMIYLGCVQVSEVVAVYRKTTTTTRTIADLTSQQIQVSNSTLQGVLNASSQVMAPYSNANLRMIITQVTVTGGTTTATVNWSYASGTGAVAATVGSTLTLPADVGVNGATLLIARVDYDYVADIGGFLHTDIPLSDTIYMYPRLVTNITKV